MNEIKEPRSVRRNLSKLVVPIFIETLLIMMLGAVDTIMLSQYSDNAVAAVGVVNQLIMFANVKVSRRECTGAVDNF